MNVKLPVIHIAPVHMPKISNMVQVADFRSRSIDYRMPVRPRQIRIPNDHSIHLVSQDPSNLIERKEILVAPSDKIAPRIFRQSTEVRSRPFCPFVVIGIANQRPEHQVCGF